MASFAALGAGARSLIQARGFTAAAVTALALGLGATTAIFSVIDAVLLKGVPFRDANRLVAIWEKNVALNRSDMFVAPANYLEWLHSRALESAAAVQDTRLNLVAGPNGHIEPEEINVERASAVLFPLLGVNAVIGRTFREDEDKPGQNGVALLSHSLWTRRFGQDRSVLNKSIQLGNRSYTVLGVLPAGFSVLEQGVDVWTPIALDPGNTRAANGGTLYVIARLARGVAIEEARAELDSMGKWLEQANPRLNSGWRPAVFSLREQIVGNVQRPLLVLTGAVGLLLLIACANVANLLLARGASRRREIAIRAALGATRGRIVGRLLAESVMLALAGGILGLVLAWIAVRMIARFGPQSVPHLSNATVDARLFLFALGAALTTGILFGALPALYYTSGNLSTALTATGRGGTMGRAGRRARNILVASEIALAALVLIGAGLLGRSFVRLRATDGGFRPDGLLTFRLPLAGGRNTASARRIAFFEQVTQRLAALPGVSDVGAVNALPLTGFGVGSGFAVAGRPAPSQDQRPMGLLRSVTPDYFRTMRIPLIAGRGFTQADSATAPVVVIVNQTLARQFWPGNENSAIGAQIVVDAPNGRLGQIVGVVGDVKPDKVDAAEWPAIYNPYPQAPAASMTVAVRTTAPPSSLASAVAREVHQLDPEQPVSEVRPMDAVVDEAIAGARFNTLVLGIFAGIAFALAAVGIYGVISYDVTERTREIGIRMAMGAQRHDVLKLVLGEGARLAACGIAVGLLVAAPLTRTMQSMLYGVTATDLYTFAGIAVLLGVVALAASYVPSRRAMRLDPLVALRHE